MKKISTNLLRDNLASYLESVTETQSPLMVCKYNKPLVVIMPVIKSKEKDNYNDYFGFFGGKETGNKFVKRVRRNKKEKEYILKSFKT